MGLLRTRAEPKQEKRGTFATSEGLQVEASPQGNLSGDLAQSKNLEIEAKNAHDERRVGKGRG